MPPPGTEQVLHFSNPALLAALIALSMALVKVLEVAVSGLIKKYGKQKDTTTQIDVSLDSETQRRINETHDKIDRVAQLLSKTDNDGTPMVYSSRSGMEAVRDIAVIIRSVSLAQERLASIMERLEGKFSQHDQQDQLTFAQMNQSIVRLLEAFDDHDRRVMETLQLQQRIKEIAEANQIRLQNIENNQRR